MKKQNISLLITLLFIFISAQLYSQPAWKRLNPTIDGKNNFPIEFFNANTGYSVVNDYGFINIIYTIDGGNSWEYSNHKEFKGSPINFKIISSSEILLITKSGFLKSTDSGLTWFENKFNLTGFQDNSIGHILHASGWTWYLAESVQGQNFPRFGKLHKTVDNGQSWNELIGIDSILSVSAPSQNKIYLARKSTVLSAQNQLTPILRFMKSIDGGVTWDSITNPTGLQIASPNNFPIIKFINENTGFILLANSKIFKTIDGGSSWRVVRDETISNTSFFIDKILSLENSMAFIRNTGTILLSNDSGENWSLYSPSQLMIQDASLKSSDKIISGSTSGVHKWEVQNNTWTKNHDSFSGTYFSAVKYLSNGNLLVGGYGIRSTYDFGKTWTGVVSGSPFPFFLEFIEFDNNIVYAAGDYLYKSTDYGVSFVQLQNFTNFTKLNGYDFLDKNTGMFVGRYGRVVITLDGGLNIYEVDGVNHSFGHLFGVTAANQNRFISISRNKLFITDDLAQTWSTISINPSHHYNNIVRSKNGQLYLFGGVGYYGAGLILKSEDNGNTWQELQPLLSSGEIPKMFTSIFTGDDNEVYLSTWDGYFLKSLDGGESWSNPESMIMLHEDVTAMDFRDEEFGFAVGYNGTVKMTTTGGQISIEPIQNFVPEVFMLHQNYPNPFNPTTKITFDLSEDTRVSLKVFDITGREIATILNNEFRSTGRYTFDFNGARFSSGVYFYRLEAGGYIQSRKMILLK